MEKQKIVLKLELDDDKTKQKAMKNVCSHLGVESVSMDMKEKKMTVVGHVDITNMVKQLRKLCHTDLVLVGSVAEKEEEPKKMEPKKIEPKKMEPKKMEPKKPKEKKDSKDESYNNPGCAACTRHYYYYCYHAPCHVEEYPNACVIC